MQLTQNGVLFVEAFVDEIERHVRKSLENQGARLSPEAVLDLQRHGITKCAEFLAQKAIKEYGL